ncbi:hypothetical protein Tco_0899236 [Tanacetum coccineum]
MNNNNLAVTGATPSRPIAFREDCWTEDATSTLIDVWGSRYVELNRGNLRQKDWQDVADAVNALHGLTKKTVRSDVQCKNRIDTLKKKYKVEKARVSQDLVTTWPFFERLDVLIGPAVAKKSTTPLALQYPVLPQKRPAAAAVDESYFRRNYSAVAAAAAAAEEEGSEEEEEEELGTSDGEDADRENGEGVAVGVKERKAGDLDSMKRLANAIERFGEIYERVEGEKQKQMIELEKQRMQFTKDLEVQRMQLFMDTQVQLEKIKQAKRTLSDDDDDVYS